MKSKVASAIWLGSFAALIAVASHPALAQSRQLQALQSQFTSVARFPDDLPADAEHGEVAVYAWRLFLYGNQGTSATLTDGSTRENPTKNIQTTGATSGPLPYPTIFEAFYHRTEAYPNYPAPGTPPSPLKQAPVYRFASIGGKPFTVTNGQYVNLDETNQIGQNSLYYRQSKNKDFPVLFMAKVNSTAVKYSQGKAAINFQPSRTSTWVFPPNGTSKENTIEVKSAWRRASDIVGDKSRYHLATATWYEGLEGQVPTVKTDTFALIAIHIVQKLANYPTFIFSTFEHVDAVARDASGTITDPAYQLTYDTLSYDSATGQNPVASFTGASDVNAPGNNSKSDQTTKNFVLPPAGPAPNASHPPSPIKDNKYKVVYQPQTINNSANSANIEVGLMLGNSVWRNYRLKGVQARPTSDQTAQDYYLANIVVESSEPGMQLFRGGVSGTGTPHITNNRTQMNISVDPMTEKQPVPQPKFVMGGCMGCHGLAQQGGKDFSFLPPNPLSAGKAVDAVIPAGTSPAVRAATEKAIAIRRGYLLEPHN